MYRVRTLLITFAFTATLTAAACSDDTTSNSPTPGGSSDASVDSSSSNRTDAVADAGDPWATDGGFESVIKNRPYVLKQPANYDPATPTPLLILLHGYGSNSSFYDSYFGIGAEFASKNFLYALPEGTVEDSPDKKTFWNATDACCNFYRSTVDDVGYIRAIMDDVASKYNLDKKRVYIVGHSNGAFLAYRLACELSERISGIVSVAGAMNSDLTKCNPTKPVSLLEIHSTTDGTINYDGATVTYGADAGMEVTATYPSAHVSVTSFASKIGCTGSLASTGVTLDLDTSQAGAETTEEKMSGCPTGVDAQLWSMAGANHLPSVDGQSFADKLYTFLDAHPKQ